MPNRLTALFNALKATNIPFALEAWNEKPTGDAYGVMTVTTDSVLMANDVICERIYRGTVYLFTFKDGYTDAAKVENALKANADSYSMVEMRFFNEVQAYRRAYDFEVV